MPCYNCLHARDMWAASRGRKLLELKGRVHHWAVCEGRGGGCPASLGGHWQPGQSWLQPHGHGTAGPVKYPQGCLWPLLQSYYKPQFVPVGGQHGKNGSFHCSHNTAVSDPVPPQSQDTADCSQSLWHTHKCPLGRKSSPALHKLLQRFATAAMKPNGAAACPTPSEPRKASPFPQSSFEAPSVVSPRTAIRFLSFS